MKKFLSSFAGLLFVLLLIGAGCSGTTDDRQEALVDSSPEEQEKVSTKAGFLSYENTAHGITIQYPKKWEREDMDDAPIVAFYSPQDGSTDLFRENFNIIVADLEGYDIGLKEYVDLNITEVEAGIPEYASLELKKVSVADTDAYRTTYSGNLEGADLKWTQWYLLKEGIAYVVTYSGSGDGYDKYLGTAVEMTDTMIIE